MKPIKTGIDLQIEQAQREGKFDNLPGTGKPLHLEENPNADPEWRLAHKILKDNQFTLPWIDEGRTIETEFNTAVTALAQSWSWASSGSAPLEPGASLEWERALTRFVQSVDKINKKIALYNLHAPARFEKLKINPAREIQKIQEKLPRDQEMENKP